ncbi:MAG: bifunctional 5,10-methylene-tetrahydrofolate dehydrogenase/5,10-methylene-tetrahydrofolate cyclohydrolase [Actinobacteria bacterium]|nr:bifunctional 5,10-methylene-tetrahydrofolate dehydrogenase/5,10-methylene-tetrahydrofolate cyclohydrolase [Actinomycetota bacterium]
MAEILKGADVVAALNEKMTAEVTALKENGVTPTLAILRVGERPDEISYETGATKRCATVGVGVKHVLLPENTDQSTLLSAVEALNEDDSVHGVLILFPLPKHIDGEAVRNALNPRKDVDGITDISVAGVFTGASHKGFAPCTPHACMEILDYYGVDCTGKKAVVIGRSLVVGKPAAMMLLAKNATVTVCHTKTVDIPAIARDADIIIVAAGKMNAITAEYFSPGQTVIDVGINWNEEEKKLCGDVKFDEAEAIVGAITPVPGGVGSVTTSVLVKHVIEAAKRI